MVVVRALAVVAGAVIAVNWHVPLSGVQGCLLLASALALLPLPVLRLPAMLLAGFALASIAIADRVDDRLAAGLAGEELLVSGRVVDLPARDERRTRFRLRPQTARHAGRPVGLPDTLRLSWYGPERPELVPGERWRFLVRLREPQGRANPGGFDYARWLFREGVGATGYVRGGARRLAPAPASIDGWRARLRAIIHDTATHHSGKLAALAIGDRTRIDDTGWQVLIATGTNHLLAISGLHIGLAASAGFLAGRGLWHILPGLAPRLPRPLFAALVALGLAGIYAALAGFAIPTQRALIMLVAALAVLGLRRRVRPSATLAIAMAGVVLVDPLAPLASGFWLSFAAVAAILYVVCGRTGRRARALDFAHLQVAIGLALTPLLLLLFARTSLAGPLANLVAVPWVSLLVVPPTLAGTLLAPLSPAAGGALLVAADTALVPLWSLLEWLAAQPWAEFRRAAPAWPALALATVGILGLLAPRGLPVRGAAVVCLLPLLAAPAARPAADEVWIDVLDSPAGGPAVIRTHRHTVVYGTGSAAGEVLAFLRHQRIDAVDRIIVPRVLAAAGDAVEQLRAAWPRADIRTPDPGSVAAAGARACRAGDSWIRDGVVFRFVHPRAGDDGRFSGGDYACVLRVDAPGASILLPGPIGERARWFLLARDIELDADALVADTGADGKALVEFMRAVEPRWLVMTATQPAPAIPGRVLRTRCGGTARIVIDAADGVQQASTWRGQHPPPWHIGCGDRDKSGRMRTVAPALPGQAEMEN